MSKLCHFLPAVMVLGLLLPLAHTAKAHGQPPARVHHDLLRIG